MIIIILSDVFITFCVIDNVIRAYHEMRFKFNLVQFEPKFV